MIKLEINLEDVNDIEALKVLSNSVAMKLIEKRVKLDTSAETKQLDKKCKELQKQQYMLDRKKEDMEEKIVNKYAASRWVEYNDINTKVLNKIKQKVKVSVVGRKEIVKLVRDAIERDIEQSKSLKALNKRIDKIDELMEEIDNQKEKMESELGISDLDYQHRALRDKILKIEMQLQKPKTDAQIERQRERKQARTNQKERFEKNRTALVRMLRN